MSLLRLRAGVVVSSDIPAAPLSVTAPSVGTELSDVWALHDTTATGPRSAFTNGTWSGSIDAYLTSKGVTLDNQGQLFCNMADGSSKTFDNYDFTGAPNGGFINFYGDGITVTFNDCRTAGEVRGVLDGNGNPQGSKTINMVYNYHDFAGTGYAWGRVSGGSVTVHRSRYRNQIALLAYIVFGRAFQLDVTHTQCLITGGGQNPDIDWHGELFQDLTASSSYTGTWLWDENLVNFNEDQAVTANLWTAIMSLGDQQVTLSNSIWKGVKAINDAGGATNAVLGYGDTTVGRGCAITNCIIEDGVGVSIKHGGGSLFPTVSGNRRLTSNTPITLADCG